MNVNPWRWAAWVGSIILLLAIGWLWSDLEKIEDGGTLRACYHGVAWLGMLAAVFAFPAMSQRRALFLIFGAAILVRIAFWSAPVSDDVNRYLWEGRLYWEGENAYSEVADSEEWSHLRDGYWEAMNHRDRLTAYPPGMELVMAGASWVWYDLRVFKVVAVAGDLWVLGILALLLNWRGKPLRWLGVYAFNPVILASFAAEAHLDSLMVGGLLAAVFFAERKSWSWAWFWLGVAVQMKLMVLVVAPFLFLLAGWRMWWRVWPFLVALVVPSLFFISDLDGLLHGLLGFGGAGAFNGGLFEFLRWLGIPEQVLRPGLMMFFLSVIALYSWRALRGAEDDLGTLSLVALGWLVVCSPVIHFWYLSWLIPLIGLRPQLSWLILSGSMGVYFLAWENDGTVWGWGYPNTWVIWSWLPFFVVLFWENRFLMSRFRAKRWEGDTSLDIVLPIYNAGEGLGDFLNDLQAVSPEVGKIWVVDGGSQDGSVEMAKEAGCEVLTSEKGRGAQIAAGFAQSTAGLVAIIHADTLPQRGWISEVQKVSTNEPKSTGFILGQRFDVSSLPLLFVEILNEGRAMFGGSAFGDQTMVLRRAVVEAEGGFPEQALMEDVEVSWRLLSAGPLSYLGREWQVSAQKWKGRFGPRFYQVVSLMIRYRWARLKGGRVGAAALCDNLYREYYKGK